MVVCQPFDEGGNLTVAVPSLQPGRQGRDPGVETREVVDRQHHATQQPGDVQAHLREPLGMHELVNLEVDQLLRAAVEIEHRVETEKDVDAALAQEVAYGLEDER